MNDPWKYTAIVLLVLLVTIGATAGIIQSQSGNGKYDTDGDGLIEISSLEQLNAVRYDLDGDGNSTTREYSEAFPTTGSESVCNSGCGGYELIRDLDFNDPASYTANAVNSRWTTGTGWLPIGINDDHFTATFNGNGHAISNLYIRRTTRLDSPGQIGLFGIIGGSSTVREVSILDAQITAVGAIGPLVGANGPVAGGSDQGTIRDTHASGSVRGTGDIGGLVGFNRGTIANSRAETTVAGTGDDVEAIGGLVGANSGAIIGSHATGAVSSDGNNTYVGGLVGYGSGSTIEDSYATGQVSGRSFAGGLAGSGYIISNSYATGKVSAAAPGGLVGQAGGTITASYASGDVISVDYGRSGGLTADNLGTIRASYATGNVTARDAGGLAGDNSGTIVESYYTGTVQGSGDAGGLAGWNQGTIIASYATGTVQGGNQAGGLAGRNEQSIIASYATATVLGEGSRGGIAGINSGNITWSYWDTQTSAVAASVGEGDPSGAGGRTTVELQGPTGYTGLYSDWNTDLDNEDGDFDPTTGADDFWHFGTSRQYPTLRWQTEGQTLPTPTPEPTPTFPVIPTPTSTPPATQACRQLLGALTTSQHFTGEWTSDCQSATQGRGYARFYTFNLTRETQVTITLDSDNTDTYLYLREGDATSGDYLQENDDHQGSTSRSMIQAALSQGTYTVEATTYHRNAAGSFSLSIQPAGPGTQPPEPAIPCGETISGDGTFLDSLTTQCQSEENQDKNARFHTFTLRSESQVTITLESGDFDTFLYLREGASRSGASLYLNDDHEGSTSMSRLQELLAPGTYTIEVTTYRAGETGQYSLTLQGIGAAATRECELQMTLQPGESCRHLDFTIEVDSSGTALLRFHGDRIDIGDGLAVAREGNNWTIGQLP